jgi:hypothetical protein
MASQRLAVTQAQGRQGDAVLRVFRQKTKLVFGKGMIDQNLLSFRIE